MIDEYIQNLMLEKQIPGMSVAVIREGEPLLMQGYGMANLEHSVPFRSCNRKDSL
jgi:D-alanyl-D-alanine carboxypeptidase